MLTKNANVSFFLAAFGLFGVRPVGNLCPAKGCQNLAANPKIAKVWHPLHWDAT
jgi:hypothetical protein